MRYEIVTADLLLPLVTQVNTLLSQGWEPLGAPFVYAGHWCQAMTKTL